MATLGEREQFKKGAGAGTGPPPETEATSVTGTPEAPAPPPAAPSTRGRGRPPKKPEEAILFFDRLKNFTHGEWENYMAYLYRTAPLTDAKKGGASANYVTKFGQAFDEEVVKHECGSGGYKVLLNHIGADGKSKTVEVFFFDILDPKFPPKIPPGAWLDDARNEKWAWAKPSYEQEGKTQQQAATAGLSDMPGAIHAVAEIIKVLKPGDGATADPFRQLNAISDLLERHKPEIPPPPPAAVAPDPATQFAAMAAALKSLRPDPPPPDNTSSKLIELILAQNARLEERNTLLLEEMVKQRSTSNPTDIIKETLNAARQLRGLASTESENPWVGAVVNLADRLSPALEAFVSSRAAPSGPSGQPGGAPPPDAGSGPSAPASDEKRQAFMQHRAMMLQISSPMLAHLQNGQPGGEFAAWFVDGYGFHFFNQLKGLGKDQIMLVIKSIPEVWNQLQPIDQLFSVFIGEFLAWTPEAEPGQTIDHKTPPATEEPPQ